MKKISVAIVTIAMLAISCLPAFAVVSPEVDVPECTKPCYNGGGYCYNAGGSCGSPALSTTSAKTGVSASPAVFAALGVVACGGVAVVAKKRIKA